MLTHAFRRWMKSLAGRRHAPMRRRSAHLRVEFLEDRTVPSTLHVGAKEPYTTIQAAVNAANPGDQIQIDPGVYQSQVFINKPISLQGQNGTIILAPMTLGAPTVANPDAIVEVTATSVQIQNLTIEGAAAGTPNLYYGVRADGLGSVQLQNCTITNIIDSSNPSLGVAVDVGNTSASPDGTGPQVGFAALQNDVISNYQRAGIVVTNTGSFAEIRNNLITAGAVHAASQTGIEVSAGATADIENNTITGNTNASNGTGILVFNAGMQRLPDYDSDPNDFSIVTVVNNKISGNDDGIYGSQDIALTSDQPASVDIENNQITGNTYVGIEFNNSSNLLINNNQLSNNGSNNTADGGIYLSLTTNSTLTNNHSQNNDGSGIYLDAGSTGNDVQNNQMQGNVFSKALGNADAVDESTGTGTAGTGNIWVGDQGKTFITPSGQSLLQGPGAPPPPVAMPGPMPGPGLMPGPMPMPGPGPMPAPVPPGPGPIPGLPGGWPAPPGTLRVGAKEPYHTIQAAVNAASPGATIQIDPGVYQEQVTITKPLTLQGQNGTIILAPMTLGAPTVANPDAIVEVTATSVQIQNLTIEGAAAGTPNLYYGVRADGLGSVQLQNCTITNIIDSSNPSLGVAVDVGNTSASPDGTGPQVGFAALQNDVISNYQRAGIVVTNSGSYAEIQNNLISASAAEHPASQIGVEVSEGATADIEYNAILGNSNDSSGAGIVLYKAGMQRLPDYDADPNDFLIVTVANNRISDNDYGIYGNLDVALTSDQPASAVIVNNQITGNTYVGMEFDNSSNLLINNNQISNNGSNNTADGGIYLFQSTDNVLANNHCQNNDGSGIYLDSGSTGNIVQNNQLQGNVFSTSSGNADAVDESTGSGTAGTGNIWIGDQGKTFITVSGKNLFQH